MSTFGDKREPAGLVCTEDNRGAAELGILEKYLKILKRKCINEMLNVFQKVDTLHKYEEGMCGSSEEEGISILFATLWKNVHSNVKNSCSRTECGVRKHFQKIPVVKGLQLCTFSIQKRNTTASQSEVLTSHLLGSCPSHDCQVVLFPHS